MKKILILLIILYPIKVFSINDTSHSSIVMDIDSGRILYQHDSNTERLIASTTKLMTFLVTVSYAYDKLDSEVTVGEEVLKMYGTNMYLSLNERLTLKDLLYGLILRSGNDASVVISKYVAGDIDNFVYLMNLKAIEIGMTNTKFSNPHGLDEETKNYSTAYDLGVLTRYLFLNYPIFKEIAGTKYYDFKSNLKSYNLVNRSKIIFTYKNILTAKNGYTPNSGKCLVTTASNNDLNLLIVTLDDFDIYSNHERLYNYYFNKYKNKVILNKDTFKVPNYYIKNNYSYPLTKEEITKIDTQILLDNKNNGTVEVLLDNKIIHKEVLYKIENKNNSLLNKIKKYLEKIGNNLSFKKKVCYH